MDCGLDAAARFLERVEVLPQLEFVEITDKILKSSRSFELD